MTAMNAEQIVAAYFAAFNAGDSAAMLALVTEDVAHHVNQGAVRRGKPAFAEFLAHMERCYDETLRDIVIMTQGDRAAAEFTVHGLYKATDGDLPPARGQRYTLPAGSFFVLRGGQIARVSTHYNLPDWIAQVEGGA